MQQRHNVSLFANLLNLKVKGPDILYTAAYWETRAAAVYNAKWRTGQHWQ